MKWENAEKDANRENEETAQNPGACRSIHELSFEQSAFATKRAGQTQNTPSRTNKAGKTIRQGPQFFCWVKSETALAWINRLTHIQANTNALRTMCAGNIMG